MAASKSAATSLGVGTSERSSGKPAGTWATAATAELTGKTAGREPPTQPLNLSSSVVANSKPASAATKATKASTNAATNAATKADQRARAIKNLEAKLAAKKAPTSTELISGSVPNRAKAFNELFSKRKPFVGVQPKANAEENANLNVLQANINGFLKNQRPTASVPIEQQLRDEMALQQQKQAEINALIQSEMDHRGITTPRSISEASRTAASPPAASQPAAASVPANLMTNQTVPNESKLLGLPHYTQHIKHSASALDPISQAAPFEIPQSLMNQQNEFYKSNNGARERYLEKQAKFAAQNAEIKKKENTEALVGRRAVEAAEAAKAEAKPKAKQKNLTSLNGAPTISGKSVMPAPKSAPQPLPEPQSYNPSKMTKGMKQFAEKQLQHAEQLKKREADKLRLSELSKKLKEKMKKQKANTGHFGGTRKKTKQSRKKIQTRKRSTKRSTRNKTK